MKKYSMKKLFVLALTLLASLSFAQKVITISGFPNLTDAIQPIIDKYMEEHPDVKVELEVREFADHHNNLVTTLAAGSGATDVVAIEVGFIAKFVADGGLVDLNAAPYNAGEFTPGLADYAVAQGTTADGRMVAMPTDLGPGIMFYRRDRLSEVDAKVEELLGSWDDYIAFGKKVTRDTNSDGVNDVFLIADAGDVYNAMIRSGLEEGQGIYFDADGNTLVNSERFHEAFRVAKEIRDNGLDAKIGAWSNEWYEAFKQGTVATQFSGAWLQGHLQNWMAPDTAGLWGAENLPGGAYATWGGSFYAIPEQSQNKELAWDLIKFMTTREDVQLLSFDTIEAFPALKSTWKEDVFNAELPFLDGQKARQLYINVVNNIAGTVTYPGDVIAAEVVTNALTSVLNDGVEIDAALAEAEQIIKRRAR
jgi:multiple sugar transport system substrate-binding protein